MDKRTGKDWPLVYLPIGSFGDALATMASMKLGYVFRKSGYGTFIAARAIGLGSYWQIGFPRGGRVLEEKRTCLFMPVFRIEMDYTVHGYVDTSACVTRYPFSVTEPFYGEEVPISVPLYLLAKFFMNPQVVRPTAGLVLGYFQYKIEDYPHPLNIIDHPGEGIYGVIPLIHSLYRVYIDTASKKGQSVLSRLGSESVKSIEELPDKVVSDATTFLETTLGINNPYDFLTQQGIFIYRLLPVMYFVLKEVE